MIAILPHVKTGDHDYYGLGDDQDHNDLRGRGHSNPVYQARHCTLFHELTEHCDVPHKHLIRIGCMWADFEVIYQNAVDIDLIGKHIVANQQETFKGKLKDASSIYCQQQNVNSDEKAGVIS